jgi:hypothetical protein
LREIDNILKVIDLLNKYIDGYYIVAGSWALYFYRFKYKGFLYPLKTLDIDFILNLYVRNKPIDINLKKLLEDLEFYPSVEGTVTGYNYSIFRGKDIDIEFIIEEPAGYKGKILRLENLSIDTTPLPFVSDLLKDIIFVNIKNIKIPLPSQEVLHIHKWIIVKRRKNNIKKQNDLLQGKEILKICNPDKLENLIKHLKGKRKKLYEKSKIEVENIELY